MKGTQHSALKQAIPADNAPPAASLNALAPGLVPAAVGLIIAVVLVWVALMTGPRQQDQLVQAWGGSQASAVSLALLQINADTQAAASSAALVQALQSNDASARVAAQERVTRWGGLSGARLYPKGLADVDTQGVLPVSFATLDMLNKVAQGEGVAPEARKVGERWLIYSAAPVRAGADQPVLGTLLLAFDMQRLLDALPVLPAEAGQIVLSQQFGSGHAQVFLQRGQADGDKPQGFDTGFAGWKLEFTPGAGLKTSPSIVLLLLALVIAGAGVLLGLHRNERVLQRRICADARQLDQLLQELSRGKAVKPFGLSLPALSGLAQALARVSLRSQPQAVPVQATSEQHGANITQDSTSPAVVASRTDWTDPLFQDTDILDIDLLDENQDFLRSEHPLAMNSPASVAPILPDTIFRAYDIRGVVGDTLNAETAYWIGRAIGSESLAQNEPNVSVGRDGRLSGPELVQQLIQGLHDSGCHVSDVGLVPTPALYYAANVLAGKTGVMLTGSHNPKDYNGFKIVIAGDTLANEQIQALHERIKTNNLTSQKGSITQVNILDRYFKQIKDDIVMARKLKVVVDCGNGAAGVIAPQLIEALGCEVISLFAEVDGNFPNHHPDPGKLENLQDLIAKVKETGADLGLAFDGDGDRVGVVTNAGNVVYPDRLLMLFALDVLKRNPGADIIFDVKCTRRLTPLISEHGGRPVMWKTGHSLIKKEMKKSGALLAGEMSGHIFFKERWFGFDDGIYSAARLLEILSQEPANAEDLFETFPNDISTPEINIKVTDVTKFSIIEALEKDAQWGDAKLTTIDGVRVDYPKGWGLVRASNTTPVLVLRFEAETQAELERIQGVFHAELKKVAPDLDLPF
ncbi:Phosphomannomutase Phosphoglucomutase [Pseudomonas syringae pv. maculicola]|uniref:Phosphomannomutase/phosphoglucomutase n=1 Tax=Pseudomonas syringae pv. maculicola TaxID=59511 RepID=A0A0N1JIY6_PSEYM|nr:phosphomannomutase/phosphoglucomutase [Pseudomonas syringae group genomosp. 3]KPC14492.1 Phosphomannomutase Phosphoglucomutase [Pseudomonas syringae pv. maculicola]RMM76676.1 Phosphomannomutase Phosphoglucomutase [Pseudomonas syringae pv. maculicola]RMV31489.1 Phosphomannomutase Phosphoglucomutase [Pseudomonas syringae pv. maculicola]